MAGGIKTDNVPHNILHNIFMPLGDWVKEILNYIKHIQTQKSVK